MFCANVDVQWPGLVHLSNIKTRLVEQARQNWHLTLDRRFPATVNHRNEAMMKEAGSFAMNLRRCEKDIRTVKEATAGVTGRSAHIVCLATLFGGCFLPYPDCFSRVPQTFKIFGFVINNNWSVKLVVVGEFGRHIEPIHCPPCAFVMLLRTFGL